MFEITVRSGRMALMIQLGLSSLSSTVTGKAQVDCLRILCVVCIPFSHIKKALFCCFFFNY